MIKDYTLSKSDTTGWWVWTCSDGSKTGSATTKKQAKKDAKANCPVAFVLDPPDFNAVYTDGSLMDFTVKNLDLVPVQYTTSDISEDEFDFFFGLVCDEDSDCTTRAQKAITILKFWGIYNGGTTEPEIKTNHDMSDTDFQRIIEKDYIGLHIHIDDDVYTWTFPE